MILGYPGHAGIFKEIDEAVSQLTDKLVMFNSHSASNFQIPKEAIIYNLENLIAHPEFTPQTENPIWDYSKTNLSSYSKERSVAHVPIGYHPSMERFVRIPDNEFDVVFVGSMNKRREKIVKEIKDRGFRVIVLGPQADGQCVYGNTRDAVLSRARLAINIHYYVSPSIFESVRMCHLIANGVPVITEDSDSKEEKEWGLAGFPYYQLVDQIEAALKKPQEELEEEAKMQLKKFKQSPLQLPA